MIRPLIIAAAFSLSGMAHAQTAPSASDIASYISDDFDIRYEHVLEAILKPTFRHPLKQKKLHAQRVVGRIGKAPRERPPVLRGMAGQDSLSGALSVMLHDLS